MASTYSNVLLQFVFAPKNRIPRFNKFQQDSLTKIFYRIAVNKKVKPLAVKCMSDHIHLAVYVPTSYSCSQVASFLKANSSRWINQQSWYTNRFEWQTGYGVFSYSHWDKTKIRDYINNQEEHHRKKTFREEYVCLLRSFGVDYQSDQLLGIDENGLNG